MRVGRDESLRLVPERHVEGAGEAQVDREVVGQDAQQLGRLAGTIALLDRLEQVARALGKGRQLGLAVEQRFDLGLELRALELACAAPLADLGQPRLHPLDRSSGQGVGLVGLGHGGPGCVDVSLCRFDLGAHTGEHRVDLL